MKARVVLAVFVSSLLFMQFAVFANEPLEEKVTEAISARYTDNVDISADDDGNVTLEGQVNTLYDKNLIFETVTRVPGVKTISNQLTVDAPVIADNVIRANILQQLEYVSSIYEPDKLKVSVDNGIVFFDGKVNFYREKLMAKTVASWQQGVKGVENRIKVMEPEEAKSDENLKEVLTHVLEDEFPIEDNVKFTVNDGKVTLNGTATTLWAKYNIEEEFLNVIGIRVVDNNLVVEPLL